MPEIAVRVVQPLFNAGALVRWHEVGVHGRATAVDARPLSASGNGPARSCRPGRQPSSAPRTRHHGRVGQIKTAHVGGALGVAVTPGGAREKTIIRSGGMSIEPQRARVRFDAYAQEWLAVRPLRD